MEIDAPPIERPTDPAVEPKRARTSTRTISRSSRVELITRGEPRRRWSTEQKQAIAAKSFEPGMSAMEVARAYGISGGLMSTWRRALLAAQPASAGAVAKFARVRIARPKPVTPSFDPPRQSEPQPRPASLIEIVLPGGTAVRVDVHIDPRALRRVLAALRA